MKWLKVLAAVFLTIFLMALGAYGGCLAGLMGASTGINSLWPIGIIGGILAGLWGGILISKQILDERKPDQHNDDEKDH